jgi:NADH-quinone oxidoreductase subunit C
MLADALGQLPLAIALEAAEPGALVGGKLEYGELTLEVSADRIAAVCGFLKHAQQFSRLADLTAVDWRPREPRFEVVYHLHSFEKNQRVRLKCAVGGDAPELDSVTGVWRSANWHEREVFDLFGIVFNGHPNPRRIMLPEDWEGHPLRKDYPVHGNRYGYKDE